MAEERGRQSRWPQDQGRCDTPRRLGEILARESQLVTASGAVGELDPLRELLEGQSTRQQIVAQGPNNAFPGVIRYEFVGSFHRSLTRAGSR
jgi:hypothetical protein